MRMSQILVRPVLFAGLVALSFGLAVPAFAVDDDSTDSGVDLTSVRTKIAAGDYKSALAELRGIAEDTQAVDVYNLMGFTLRKTGDATTSLAYYRKALELKPDYRPAHEYLGELFLETGRRAEAEGELATLAKLCPEGCEERADLEKAFAAGGATAKPAAMTPAMTPAAMTPADAD
jgi:tetratricopeptide (TPR) repeat protein